MLINYMIIYYLRKELYITLNYKENCWTYWDVYNKETVYFCEVFEKKWNINKTETYEENETNPDKLTRDELAV